jgi:hypothetical protein
MDHSVWKRVVLGLFTAALFAYVLDPILKILPSVVLRVATAISDRYADYIYHQAAVPPVQSIDSLLIAMMGVVACSPRFGS